MLIDTAVELAAKAHRGQVDKQCEPYILHPLRVMLAVPQACRVVAVLHDTLEDTKINRYYLRQELHPEEWEALNLVTRPPMTTYPGFIERIAKAEGDAGWIAREVKEADIEDNIGRWTEEIGRPLWNRYRQALEVLRGIPA